MALAALLALASLGQAQQTTAALTNGPGNCSAAVTVDGYGSFGLSSAPGTDLMFDRAGALGVIGTTFQSAVLVTSSCGANVWLTQGAGYPTAVLPVPPVFTGAGLTATSGGPIPGGLTFRLVQTLNTPVDLDCGTTLLQRYEITNTNAQACDLCIMRAVDFDMNGAATDRTAASVTTVGGNVPNDHWISQWDDPDSLTGPVASITAEGVQANGAKAVAAGFRSGLWPFFATLNAGCGSLTRAIVNDTNLDLINVAPEVAADCVSAIGARYPQVPPGATIVFVTRTRLSTRPGRFTHDVVPLVEAGNVGIPTLHVNGSAGPCVVAGGPITVSMAGPPSGTPGHYIIYIHVGKPLLGGITGGATAPDWCIWDIPGFGNLGDGSFNVGPFPVSGRGGLSTPGFAIFSSVAGLAVVSPLPLAAGPAPGAPIFGPVPLPAGLTLTLQGALVDIGGGVSIKVTNAVEIVTAPALCQP
jgi:hypothetical protein